MSAQRSAMPSQPQVVLDVPVPPAPSSVWDRITSWASDNKAAVYTAGAIVLVVTGAGVAYYVTQPQQPTSDVERAPAAGGEKKKSKKERRKAKKHAEDAKKGETASAEGKLIRVAELGAPQLADSAVAGSTEPKAPSAQVEDELPDINETIVAQLSDQERKEFAARLKDAGNKAYGSKNYNEAIELYRKAILCRPDPIFYSNRAACYNALGDWEKVVDDTTAALELNNEYVKALNRRANAYEHLDKNSEALLDCTASCIIDGFSNDQSAQSVERLLKKVAEAKGKHMLAQRQKKLPSSTFVKNYLQSFRSRPPPEGLHEAAELEENSGLGQLRAGLVALEKRTGEAYEAAAESFEKAIALDRLGEHEAFAYSMRATFKYLKGENDGALEDLSKSIELQPSLTQSYIKRASMHLEIGNRDAAAKDFESAINHNASDPDIYYHRAQLHFILGEFNEAARDYQESISLDKDFIFSHIQLGVTQYKMGSVASSMATFRRCIKNFDKVPDVYNYYGELLLDQQKYGEAIQKFDTAVDMEKLSKPAVLNVLPLINKALALFQWKQDFAGAEKLCESALSIDPECDIAVATMAQLLLQQGKVREALTYFESAAKLSRTEGEIVNALSYAEATRTQLEVQEKYPRLAARINGMGGGFGGPPVR